MPTSPRMPRQRRGIKLKGRSAPRRGVLLPSAAKVPKNAVQTCGLKIPHAPSHGFLSCKNKPRERCAMEISPKYCIVSASRSAAAFALKCRTVRFFDSRQELFSNGGQRPPPTFAAPRQRLDLIIAPSPGGCFQRGRAAALPIWPFKEGESLRGKEVQNFPPPFQISSRKFQMISNIY